MTDTQNDLMMKRLAFLRDAVEGIAEDTNTATDNVLKACEAITPDTMDEHMVTILKACAVQDLTNQRIIKIIDYIDQIETGHYTETDALLAGPQRDGKGMSQDDVDSLLDDLA